MQYLSHFQLIGVKFEGHISGSTHLEIDNGMREVGLAIGRSTWHLVRRSNRILETIDRRRGSRRIRGISRDLVHIFSTASEYEGLSSKEITNLKICRFGLLIDHILYTLFQYRGKIAEPKRRDYCEEGGPSYTYLGLYKLGYLSNSSLFLATSLQILCKY